MNGSSGNFADEFDAQLPADLQNDLRALYEPGTPIPVALNDRILNRARAQFARRRASRRLLRWAGAAAAAAAVILLVIWFQPHPAAGDVDRNGRIDILDALVLAQRIESDAKRSTKSHDLNHDGVVDQQDVDAIAMISVNLERGGVR